MMKKVNDKVLKGAGAVIASTAMTGCVTGTNSVKVAEENYVEIKKDYEEKEKISKVSKKNHLIKESNGLYIGNTTYKVDSKDLLPRIFKESIVLNSPDGISLGDLMNYLNDEAGLKARLTQTAATYLIKPSALYNEDNAAGEVAAEAADNGNGGDSTSAMSGGDGSQPDMPDMGAELGLDPSSLDGSSSAGDLTIDQLATIVDGANQDALGGVQAAVTELDPFSADTTPNPVSADAEIHADLGMAGRDSRTNSNFLLYDFFIDLTYDGNLRGLLDKIGQKTDLSWKYENGEVVFYRWDTKTFIVDQLPGTTGYNSSIQTGGSSSNGYTGTTSQSTTYSSTPESPFTSTQAAIEGILGETEGTLTVSEQTGTFTVTSTPEVLEKIGEYVEQINEIISKKIMIKTEIIEVRYEDTQDLGMDLSAAYSGSTQIGFSFNQAAAGKGGDFAFGLIDPTNKWTGSEAFISALNKNYETSLVNSTTSNTTNGIPVPVQVLNSKTYLKSMSSETSDTGTTYSLEPDVLNTGLNMSILPKVLSNGDVMMNVSIDLSSLNVIQEYATADGSAAIQMPDTEQRSFMQRLSVKAGQTVLVSGFDREDNTAKYDSIAGEELWGLGGKKKGGTTKTRTMILITPYTLQR